MGWLDRLFGQQGDQQTRKLDVLVERLESFMRPALSLVDSRDLTIPEKRARYGLFTCGAVGSRHFALPSFTRSFRIWEGRKTRTRRG